MDTVQQEVYGTIRKRLLSGKYKAGERLAESKLADELGVNRNPVREALLTLTGEGFLERRSGVGCRVAKIDAKLFGELMQLRESIEGTAARLAAPIISEIDLIRLEHEHELLQLMPWDAESDIPMMESNERFHRLILKASGNRTLEQVWEQFLPRIFAAEIALAPKFRSDQAYKEMHADHRAIIDALRASDADAAERVMRHHIATGAATLMRVLNESMGLQVSDQSDDEAGDDDTN
jgi:DNA-binding GntR family transcriptional regulator